LTFATSAAAFSVIETGIASSPLCDKFPYMISADID
jgi:hypothetical protein